MFDHQLKLKISKALDSLSEPDHLLHYPSQLFQYSALTYLGTAILNLTCIISTPPLHGMAFGAVAYLTHQMVAPQFTRFFTPYDSDPLAKKGYIFLKWTTSLSISKMACAVLGISITVPQTVLIIAAFLIANRVRASVLSKFRQSFSPEPISKMPMFHKRQLQSK